MLIQWAGFVGKLQCVANRDKIQEEIHFDLHTWTQTFTQIILL